jgi:hypothetical protein
MPLKICPNQQILFVQETTGYSIALHGAGTDVKGLLMNCPVLNHVLPRGALPTKPGPLFVARDVCRRKRSEGWAGANPLLDRSGNICARSGRDHDLYRIRRSCKRDVDPDAAFRAASKLEGLNP